jgi:hypothetical protein
MVMNDQTVTVVVESEYPSRLCCRVLEVEEKSIRRCLAGAIRSEEPEDLSQSTPKSRSRTAWDPQTSW